MAVSVMVGVSHTDADEPTCAVHNAFQDTQFSELLHHALQAELSSDCDLDGVEERSQVQDSAGERTRSFVSNALHSSETGRRKSQGMAKRRRRRKAAANVYNTDQRPIRSVRSHVESSIPLPTPLVTDALPHTQGAYTGGRQGGGPRRVYSLEELVGSQSVHRFRVVEWDGR